LRRAPAPESPRPRRGSPVARAATRSRVFLDGQAKPPGKAHGGLGEIAVGRRKVGPSRPAASDPDCDRDEGSRFDDQEEPAAAASKGQAQQPRSLERDPVHTDGGPVVEKTPDPASQRPRAPGKRSAYRR